MEHKRVYVVKEDLVRRFKEYNRLYFNDRLKLPYFKINTSKDPYGSCITEKPRSTIRISKYTRWTDETLKNVLIHEMIHQYVYEVLHGSRIAIFPHGIRFCYVRWRLNRKYGLKIDQIPIGK